MNEISINHRITINKLESGDYIKFTEPGEKDKLEQL